MKFMYVKIVSLLGAKSIKLPQLMRYGSHATPFVRRPRAMINAHLSHDK